MRVQEAAELVAINVFQRADRAGVPVTLAMVERRLDELLAHAPACKRTAASQRLLLRSHTGSHNSEFDIL